MTLNIAIKLRPLRSGDLPRWRPTLPNLRRTRYFCCDVTIAQCNWRLMTTTTTTTVSSVWRPRRQKHSRNEITKAVARVNFAVWPSIGERHRQERNGEFCAWIRHSAQ